MGEDSAAADALLRRIATALRLPGDLREADKYRMQSDPELLRDVVRAMAELIPPEVEVLLGLELGGVPVAAALSLHTGLPWALLRRAPSPKDGTTIAGCDVSGRRAALVVDMLQGGGKIGPAVESARHAGALVEHVIAAVAWLPTTSGAARDAGVHLWSVVTPQEAAAVSFDR